MVVALRSHLPTGAYRGADRRAVTSPGVISIASLGAVTTTAAAAAAAGGYGLGQLARPVALSAGLGTLVGMSLCVLGGLLVIGWRLGGRRRAAYVGLAVTAVGLAHIPFLTMFGQQPPTRPSIGLAAAQFGLAALGATLLVQGLLGPEVDSAFRPIGLLARFLAVLAAVGVLGAAVQTVANDQAHLVYTSHLVIFATGASWIAVATALVVLGVERQRDLVVQAGLALAVLGTGWAIKAVDDSLWLTMGAAVTVVGLAAFALAFSPDVIAAFKTRSRADSTVRQRLETAQAALEVQQQQRAEVRHELRNALTGIEGAVLTLQRHRDSLEEETAAELATAIGSELRRALAMLAPTRSMHAKLFDVAAELNPLVLTEWAAHHDVSIEADAGVVARGDPLAIAEVVRNLLRNCTIHAPGASVRIRVRAAVDGAEIVVEDDGPGFPVGFTERAFDRGWRRDSAATGEGLGLFLCRRVVAAQGGAIRAERPDGGGARVVVTLPTGVPMDDAGPGADRQTDLSGDSRESYSREHALNGLAS